MPPDQRQSFRPSVGQRDNKEEENKSLGHFSLCNAVSERLSVRETRLGTWKRRRVKQKVKPPVRPPVRGTCRENLPVPLSISLPYAVIVRCWQGGQDERENTGDMLLGTGGALYRLIGRAQGCPAAAGVEVQGLDIPSHLNWLRRKV